MDTSLKAVRLIQSSDYHWGREKVLALINSVEEFFEDFYDKSMKKKFIWNNVAEHMHGKGYTCSSVACEKKWRDLKSNYAHMLQKQVQGDTSSRFEYFDELHHILGQEIEADGTNDQGINLEEASDTTDLAEFEDLTNDGQEEKKIRIRSQKEYDRSSNQRDNSSKISKSKAGQGKTVLARIKHIESSLSIKQRLERLEARVESSKQQRETTRNTNVLLVQVLAELRRINAALKQEDALPKVQSVQAQAPNPGSCSPANQEFIIVEAYADQL